jgi:hypothetical protein
MADFNICTHIVKQQVYPSGDVSVLEEQIFSPRSAQHHGHRHHSRPRAKHRDTVHVRCLHTSVPLKYIAAHQANIAAAPRGGAGTRQRRKHSDTEGKQQRFPNDGGKEPPSHLDNFSIAAHTVPASTVSERKLRGLESWITRRKLDLQSHVTASEDLADARLVHSGEWFDRIVLLKPDEVERFVDTYDEEEPPSRTFSHAGYSAESVRLLNELSGIRFVMQKLSQEQQRRLRAAGRATGDRYTSLYPHL